MSPRQGDLTAGQIRADLAPSRNFDAETLSYLRTGGSRHWPATDAVGLYTALADASQQVLALVATDRAARAGSRDSARAHVRHLPCAPG